MEVPDKTIHEDGVLEVASSEAYQKPEEEMKAGSQVENPGNNERTEEKSEMKTFKATDLNNADAEALPSAVPVVTSADRTELRAEPGKRKHSPLNLDLEAPDGIEDEESIRVNAIGPQSKVEHSKPARFDLEFEDDPEEEEDEEQEPALLPGRIKGASLDLNMEESSVDLNVDQDEEEEEMMVEKSGGLAPVPVGADMEEQNPSAQQGTPAKTEEDEEQDQEAVEREGVAVYKAAEITPVTEKCTQDRAEVEPQLAPGDLMPVTVANSQTEVALQAVAMEGEEDEEKENAASAAVETRMGVEMREGKRAREEDAEEVEEEEAEYEEEMEEVAAAAVDAPEDEAAVARVEEESVEDKDQVVVEEEDEEEGERMGGPQARLALEGRENAEMARRNRRQENARLDHDIADLRMQLARRRHEVGLVLDNILRSDKRQLNPQVSAIVRNLLSSKMVHLSSAEAQARALRLPAGYTLVPAHSLPSAQAAAQAAREAAAKDAASLPPPPPPPPPAGASSLPVQPTQPVPAVVAPPVKRGRGRPPAIRIPPTNIAGQGPPTVHSASKPPRASQGTTPSAAAALDDRLAARGHAGAAGVGRRPAGGPAVNKKRRKEGPSASAGSNREHRLEIKHRLDALSVHLNLVGQRVTAMRAHSQHQPPSHQMQPPATNQTPSQPQPPARNLSAEIVSERTADHPTPAAPPAPISAPTSSPGAVSVPVPEPAATIPSVEETMADAATHQPEAPPTTSVATIPSIPSMDGAVPQTQQPEVTIVAPDAADGPLPMDAAVPTPITDAAGEEEDATLRQEKDKLETQHDAACQPTANQTATTPVTQTTTTTPPVEPTVPATDPSSCTAPAGPHPTSLTSDLAGAAPSAPTVPSQPLPPLAPVTTTTTITTATPTTAATATATATATAPQQAQLPATPAVATAAGAPVQTGGAAPVTPAKCAVTNTSASAGTPVFHPPPPPTTPTSSWPMLGSKPGTPSPAAVEHWWEARMREVVEKKVLGVVTKVMKHEWAFPFNQPVDAAALGLKDYHTVIQRPMDLGTVKSKIEAREYSHPEEVQADVRLTFTNAVTYNPPGSDVHLMARQLSTVFENKWTITVVPRMQELAKSKESKLNPRSSDLSRGGDPIAALKKETQRMLDDSLRDLKNLKNTIADCRPLSRARKDRLHMMLRLLPTSRTAEAATLMADRNPSLLQKEKAMIDIEGLDPFTMRRLEKFAQKVLFEDIEAGEVEVRKFRSNRTSTNMIPRKSFGHPKRSSNGDSVVTVF